MDDDLVLLLLRADASLDLDRLLDRRVRVFEGSLDRDRLVARDDVRWVRIDRDLRDDSVPLIKPLVSPLLSLLPCAALSSSGARIVNFGMDRMLSLYFEALDGDSKMRAESPLSIRRLLLETAGDFGTIEGFSDST